MVDGLYYSYRALSAFVGNKQSIDLKKVHGSTIKTAPTCFGAVTPSTGSALINGGVYCRTS
jgi:hypothetical protein